MSSSELIQVLIASLSVTIITYGAGPFFFAVFRKKPLHIRSLRWFCIGYTVLAWILWQVFTYDGNSVQTMPAILWGGVFYSIAKRILKDKLITPPEQDVPPEQQVPVEAAEMETPAPGADEELPNSGGKQDGETCDSEADRPAAAIGQEPERSGAGSSKKRRRAALVVGLVVAFCALLLFAVLQGNKDLEARVRKLEADKESTSMADGINKFLPDKAFLYYNIGFIVDGSNYYHTYDCPIFKRADGYWAHNVEYCESLGYRPCEKCW